MSDFGIRWNWSSDNKSQFKCSLIRIVYTFNGNTQFPCILNSEMPLLSIIFINVKK